MSLMMGQQVNVRPEMQQVYVQTQNTILQSLKQMAAKDELVAVGVNYLSQAGDVKIKGFIEGVINYFDYLVNAKGIAQDQAFPVALQEYAQAYSGKVLSQSPNAQSYNANLQMAIQQYAATFDTIVSEINRVIAPHIRQTSVVQGLSSTLMGGSNLGRRQATTSVGGFGGLGTGNVFGASNTPPPAGAGGLDLFAGSPAPASNTPAATESVATSTVTPEPTPACAKTAKEQLIQRRLLKLMNYQDHKTYAFLKPALASAVGVAPMDSEALNNSLQDLNQLTQYTKLREVDGLIRTDITPKRNVGYALSPLSLNYGDQLDLTHHINEEPAAAFKITGNDLKDYSYGGAIHQFFPKAIPGTALSELIDDYKTGMMTHNRFVEFLGKLELYFSPEVCKVINDKVTVVANSFWRYYLNQLNGKIENYLTGHQAVSDYLKLKQSDTKLLDVWDEFPRFFMKAMFNLVPIEAEENHPASETFFLTATYVRIPYASWNLSLGVKDDKDESFAIVAKEATPGLYHICKGLQEAGEASLHRLIVTTDGRMIEVIRPLAGDTSYFIVTELPSLL